MKILTLVYSIGRGGTERAAVNYTVAYKKAGCDSRIWILGEGHDRKSSLEAHDVTMYFDTDTDHAANKTEIIQWKPDIIHIHTFNDNINKILLPLKELGCKIVETNVFSRPRFDEVYKIIDVSFQLAYWGFWKYHKWMGYQEGYPLSLRLPNLVNSEDFTAVFPQGRTDLRKRLNIPDNAFIAGRIGQAHQSKWDRKIFDAVSAVLSKKKDVYFVFVGLPRLLKAEYEHLPAGVKKHIRLIDFIEGDRALTEFYKSIDVFVHMSKIGESFGFVLAEALLCGCPVVTLSTPFKDNAQFEVVGDKIGGYCSTSVQDFVKRLLLVYDRKDDFSPDQLYDQIDSRYSEQALVQPLLKVYRALCDNDRSYLVNLSKSTFEVAQKIVDEQMKLYKLKGLFLKMMLEVLHTPFVFKAIAGLKKKL